MGLPVKLVLALGLFNLGQGAQATGQATIAHPFKYEFYGTNVVPWSTGERVGKVTDTSGPMAHALHDFLSTAETSVDMAAYGVQQQQWLFTDLAKLKRQGVAVRAVVDQEHGDLGDWSPANFNYPDTIKLPAIIGKRNITPDVDPDGTPRLGTIMHDKFVVVDKKAVWLGSANFSATCMGAEYNANAAMLVHSPELAALYAAEFKQMFTDHLFSRYKHARATREPLVFSDGTQAEVFFSPEDDALNSAILPFIKQAQRTLDLGMFFLTDQGVADALVDAAQRGVQVRVIYDAVAAAHPASKHGYLRDNGVTVRVENWGGKMHMKGGVADGKNVVVGSMNWSEAGASQNDENTLWVRGNTKLGSDMQNYLDHLWSSLGDGTETRDPRAEGTESKNSCRDGIDNDFDGKLDQEDASCN